MTEEFGLNVKVVLPTGELVTITLNEALFTADLEVLICRRIWHGGIVCRGDYNWKTKRIRPWVKNGQPVILDVYEATTESLIDALERDQHELRVRTLEKKREALNQRALDSRNPRSRRTAVGVDLNDPKNP